MFPLHPSLSITSPKGTIVTSRGAISRLRQQLQSDRGIGMAEVEAARADGRWEAAYDGQARASVPEDLRRELEARPAAKRFFEELDGANRYAILYRLDDAKKPETRERRLRKFVEMLERGETLH